MFLLQPKPSASTPVTHSKVSVHNAKASSGVWYGLHSAPPSLLCSPQPPPWQDSTRS